jgi:hypothetical protein
MVPEGVIDFLETIQVQQHKCQLRNPLCLERRQLPMEHRAVGQSGQGIMVSAKLDVSQVIGAIQCHRHRAGKSEQGRAILLIQRRFRHVKGDQPDQLAVPAQA